MEYGARGSYGCSHGLVLTSLITANGPSAHFYRLLARDVLICIWCHDDRNVRDDPIATEQDLRQILIDMIPIPGRRMQKVEHLCETCSQNSSVGSLCAY